MRVSKRTKDLIDHAKSEAAEHHAALMRLLGRLEEHAGTKRVCKDLEKVIGRLEDWQRH